MSYVTSSYVICHIILCHVSRQLMSYDALQVSFVLLMGLFFNIDRSLLSYKWVSRRDFLLYIDVCACACVCVCVCNIYFTPSLLCQGGTHTNTHTHTHTHTHTQIQRLCERASAAVETSWYCLKERQRERDRETERQRDRETERHTHTERERESVCV